MSRDSVDRRIFVVGVPRSGTTLVQSLLAAHSAITSFTESHFFAPHFTRVPFPPGAVLSRNPARRVSEFLNENEAIPGATASWFLTTRHLRWRPWLPLQTRTVARRLLRVLDELALARNAVNWLEKTPRHLRYIPFLERMAEAHPRLHFIHVVREGLEVVASLCRASQSWERPYDLETCAERWNREVAYSASRIGALNHHFIVYEELTSASEPVVRRILAELGLPWEPELLERYGTAAAQLVTEREAWKTGVGRQIRPSGTAVEVLTAAERDRVLRSLYDDPYQAIVAAVAQRSSKLVNSG